MSPAPLINQKTEITTTAKVKKKQSPPPPPPLRTVNKDSHFIRKPSSSQQQQQRQPVIIYTHSPRIIHTDPSNFMELVQKLTGKQQNHENDVVSDPPQPKRDAAAKIGSQVNQGDETTPCGEIDNNNNPYYNCATGEDVRSRFTAAPIPEPPLINFPAEFLSPNTPLWGFADPLLFDMRSSEFREYQRS